MDLRQVFEEDYVKPGDLVEALGWVTDVYGGTLVETGERAVVGELGLNNVGLFITTMSRHRQWPDGPSDADTFALVVWSNGVVGWVFNDDIGCLS